MLDTVPEVMPQRSQDPGFSQTAITESAIIEVS